MKLKTVIIRRLEREPNHHWVDHNTGLYWWSGNENLDSQTLKLIADTERGFDHQKRMHIAEWKESK